MAAQERIEVKTATVGCDGGEIGRASCRERVWLKV
jgi:hypothetical protein